MTHYIVRKIYEICVDAENEDEAVEIAAPLIENGMMSDFYYDVVDVDLDYEAIAKEVLDAPCVGFNVVKWES